MMEVDLDDTHYCIKCSTTIVGLENYVAHRKRNCASIDSDRPTSQKTVENAATAVERSRQEEHPAAISTPRANLDHTYDTFEFGEPDPHGMYGIKTEEHGHGHEHEHEKSTKTFSDAYDLPYVLGADVFFSSLQLQSVQTPAATVGGGTGGGSSGTAPAVGVTMPSTSGGKRPSHGRSSESGGGELAANQKADDAAWLQPHGSKSTVPAVTSGLNMPPSHGGKKSFDMSEMDFSHDSPPIGIDDDDEDDDEFFDGDESSEENEEDFDGDEDSDYDPSFEFSSGHHKWREHGPPATHTGGKWKPQDEPEVGDQHPPADHTRGKWIPGTKLQRLEYKEDDVELSRTSREHYWCNICCRKLKSRANFEHHLRTSYHLKRAEPENLLEQYSLSRPEQKSITQRFVAEYQHQRSSPKLTVPGQHVRRIRRPTYARCELCKHLVLRHLIGKHLISHYHFRRMQQYPSRRNYQMILDNIGAVVLQSPFQCRPCRFYANTEEAFLLHWRSAEHTTKHSDSTDQWWCYYCRFECNRNDDMLQHLLSVEHKEVVRAINRSVPIYISKRVKIECDECGLLFRYNFQLRQHQNLLHAERELSGTASNAYQNRHKCRICDEWLTSQVALQRHERNKHKVEKFFCSICKMEFNSALQAVRHRRRVAHKMRARGGRYEVKPRQRKRKEKLLKTTTPVEAKTSDAPTPAVKPKVEAEAEAAAEADAVKSKDDPTADVKEETKCDLAQPIHKRVDSSKKRKKKDKDSNRQQHKKTKKSSPILEEKTADDHHYKCMICGMRFRTAQALGRHSRECRPAKSNALVDPPAESSGADGKCWKCNDCNFTAPYESELIYHSIYHSYGQIGKYQQIKCPVCSKEFSKYSLRCHLRQHTNEKIYECEFCKTKFSRSSNLKDHIKRLHKTAEVKDENKPVAETVTKVETGTAKTSEHSEPKEKNKSKEIFQCDDCGKSYMLRKRLIQHRLKHNAASTALRFSCPTEGCQYAASSNYLLQVHMATHSKEVRPCKEPNCSYVGKSARHLMRHMKLNHETTGNLYVCRKCDFKTKIKSHLRRHEIHHNGEKSLKCPHCDFRCISLDSLRRHVLWTGRHPGKCLYVCEKCKSSKASTSKGVDIFGTNSFQEYQKHLAIQHPNE